MIVEKHFDLDQPQRGLGGACRRFPRLDNRPRHLHPHRPLLLAQVLFYHLMHLSHIETMILNCCCMLIISLVVFSGRHVDSANGSREPADEMRCLLSNVYHCRQVLLPQV